jgi:hypothetical protein
MEVEVIQKIVLISIGVIGVIVSYILWKMPDDSPLPHTEEIPVEKTPPSPKTIEANPINTAKEKTNIMTEENTAKKPAGICSKIWKTAIIALVVYVISIVLRHAGLPGGIELGLLLSFISQWAIIITTIIAIVVLFQKPDSINKRLTVQTIIFGAVFFVITFAYRFAILSSSGALD